MNVDSEVLVGLSSGELEALAEGLLAPGSQRRFDDLLARKKAKQLSVEETVELDSLLQRADNLTILKARARLTLQRARET